ncbi:hypothetical protein KIN20_018608 [Parelaphostrongylus tenuis]|uniref:Uncharacterized protein n=1 Tax=Parelaphostrongylus tenuis TaxID=148309 RepID=A0AAD5MJT4_PARTN|nr:hypothetical protein KIN20_018608 [Parelaphostrongylus tenuis]
MSKGEKRKGGKEEGGKREEDENDSMKCVVHTGRRPPNAAHQNETEPLLSTKLAER